MLGSNAIQIEHNPTLKILWKYKKYNYKNVSVSLWKMDKVKERVWYRNFNAVTYDRSTSFCLAILIFFAQWIDEALSVYVIRQE